MTEDKVEVTILRFGINGEGVASLFGYTLFVEGGIPGERLLVRITERRKNFGRAVILEILEASADRVSPPCPVFGKCGGCQLMHFSYPRQLEMKRQKVVDALERIGGFRGAQVEPCEPSPTPLHYRNKIQLPVQEGKMGLYAKASHTLIPIEKCFIHCSLGEEVFQAIREILQGRKLPTLRHVLIKSSLKRKEVLVVLVASEEGEELRLLAEALMTKERAIKGVVLNLKSGEDNVILGPKTVRLKGEEAIEEELLGLRFTVSASSFFQVNPLQAEKLYLKALEFCALTGEERVLDAYCGVGTLSLFLAKRAREVIGIEWVEAAIQDAKENARLNGITNVTFIQASAEGFISQVGSAEVAVVNPPRKGCDPLFVEGLLRLQPRKIVYISCDPATLARDLALLREGGYQLGRVSPFDMFPQTSHVETVAELSRA